MEEGMDLMTGLVAGALLALFTGIQTWITKGRFDGIERRLDHLSTEIAALRSDLLQVALAATGRREA
jgi:hypothetical protein